MKKRLFNILKLIIIFAVIFFVGYFIFTAKKV